VRLFSYFKSVISALFQRNHTGQAVDAELNSHIELRADDLERSGIARAEAVRRARIEFGATGRIKEECHEQTGANFIATLVDDARFSLRVLRKSPGFAAAAILTLALAIGANAVVFDIMNALVLRPLDVPAADRVYTLVHVGENFSYESYANYLDFRDRNRSFEGLAVDNFSQAGLDTGNNPSRAWLEEVSGNYFDVLGLKPYLGRFFHAADEHGPNSAPYIVLTYDYWREHFDGDRSVIGRKVEVDKHPYTIIGVSPPGFAGTFVAFSTQFFLPIVNQEQVDGVAMLNDRSTHWISGVFGKLKPGVTRAQAAADLDGIEAQLEKTYPKEVRHETFTLHKPGPGSAFGGAVRTFLTGLMLLAGLILLAACANLGSLFAARAADRSREIALRLALGARRLRIVRQLLTEACLISITGGAVGIWSSVGILHWLSRWRPFPQFPLNLPLNPDANVYAVAVVLTLLSAFLFGAVPVRQILRTDPYEIVKAAATGAGGSPGKRRLNIREILLAVQIAICAVLVTSSMVAVRGLARSLHDHLGVDPQNAMLVETELNMAGYKSDQQALMQRRMIDAMQALPGVRHVGLVSSPPLHMGWEPLQVFKDQATDLKPANAAATAITFGISPGYFQAAGTALLAGRNLTWNDDEKAPHVAVVNREFVRQVFGSAPTAIGAHYKMKDGTRIEIVGIVEDGKYTANLAEDPQPAMFLPILQHPSSDTWLVLRTSEAQSQLGPEIRSAMQKLDAGLPVFVQTWSEEMNGALFAPRVATVALGLLGIMGAILSITGIFGVSAYQVSRRIREFGIRMALGAPRMQVLATALGRVIKLLAVGSAAGLLLGLLASRVLSAIVYQATPRDPLVLSGVVLAMVIVGLLATWIPAQRALSADPLILLRDQ